MLVDGLDEACHKPASILVALRNEDGHLLDVLGGADELGLGDIENRGIFEECLFVCRCVLLHGDAMAGER